MPISLPYYQESNQLPEPLPSLHEIETATRTPPTIRNPDYNGRIVVIRDLYVVKYGAHVYENEGQALLFLERCPSVPVPRLYAMYRDSGKLYIVMQLMPGTELEGLWPSLSESEKSLIAGQLRSVFQEIRSLPSPGFYGSVARGPLQHRYFLTRDQNRSINGPFETEEEFGLALSLRSRLNWEDNDRHGWISDFARNLPSSLNGHQSTFTHSDLYRKNILIQQTVDPSSKETHYTIAAIVDWESAGWYPAYWEYVASFALFIWVDDCLEKFEKIVDPLPLEAAMIRCLHQDIEF
jgi:serine/threonine protein kinase